jgi:hypothetical protein
MSKQHPGTAEVLVIEHPPGIVHGCKHCGRIHLRGRYAVGIKINEDGKEHHYMLGIETPIWCCGESKPFYQVFDDRDEATLVCEEVECHLNRHGTTEGLRLIGFRWAGSDKPSGESPAKTIG